MRLPQHYPARLYGKPAPQPWLPLDVIEAFVPLARAEGVSTVARSKRGFLTQYRRAGGDPALLTDKWVDKRFNFNDRHLQQAIKTDEAPFDEDGLPSRRHLALIMWAYSPWPGTVERIAKTL